MELDNNYEDYEDDVGLGAEDKKYAKPSQQEWFKGEKGRTYRGALVYFHPIDAAIVRYLKKKNPQVTKEELIQSIQKALVKRAEELGKSVDQLEDHEKLDTSNVRFKKIEAHFKEGVGYVLSRLGKDGAEADEVWKTMGDVKTYFTTALLLYPTNKEGELIREQLSNGWTIMPWRFSNKIYGRLHQLSAGLRDNDLSIASQDLSLTCTNTDFQNFEIDPAGKAVWCLRDENGKPRNAKFQQAVLAKAHTLYEKLVPFREISTADLRIKLGLSGPSGSDEGIADDDFGGLLDQV